MQTREDIPDMPLPDYWSVPAGYVEPHEEIKEAAIRETLEETKIELDVASVRFLSACLPLGEEYFMII